MECEFCDRQAVTDHVCAVHWGALFWYAPSLWLAVVSVRVAGWFISAAEWLTERYRDRHEDSW